MYCYPMLYPPSHHREEDHRRPVFGKVARPVHDRLRSNQSGQRRQPAPVRPVAADRSDRSHQRPGKAHSPRQVYRVKEKKEEVQPTIDPEKAKADDVVQIGNIKVVVNDAGTRPMVFGKSVNPSIQRPIMANDHEASSSSSKSKYFQPRWCPPGLTRTQRRKLQCLRAQEKEQEFKRLRDKQFNHNKPMVPQGKVWRVKAVDQPARPVESPQATGLTGTSDRSDRPEQPVRPVEVAAKQKLNWQCLFRLFAMEKHR